MITKKQKRYLKSLANTLKPLITIGKGGLTDSVLEAIDETLEAHELVKISVLNNCDELIDEMVLDIIAATHCDLISQLGKKIVIYRKSNENVRIILPR